MMRMLNAEPVAQTFCLPYRRLAVCELCPPKRDSDIFVRVPSATRRYSRVKLCATESAFTMIEIAISLAIIGFALVAIIGILPAAMSVQKDNRQETIINQDETLFMNAIRNGDRGLDDLTNYVTAITNYARSYNQRGAVVSQDTWGYTPLVSTHNGGLTSPQLQITNGWRIVGLLSTPKLIFSPGGFTSNHVVAFVRSLSGPASEKYPQNDPTVQDLALNYRLTPEVLGYGINTFYTNSNYIPPLPPPGPDRIAYTNYLRFVLTYATNVHDVRLTFRWPLKPNGDPGLGRQLYRTLVTGPLTNDPPASPFYFFQPHNFLSGT